MTTLHRPDFLRRFSPHQRRVNYVGVEPISFRAWVPERGRVRNEPVDVFRVHHVNLR